MSDVPVDFGSNGFNAWNAWNYARTTLGWTDAELFNPGDAGQRTVADLHDVARRPPGPRCPGAHEHLFRQLPRRNPDVGANIRRGGRIVLFVGRTARGDYVVYDPAGDYFTGSADNTVNRHYGGQHHLRRPGRLPTGRDQGLPGPAIRRP